MDKEFTVERTREINSGMSQSLLLAVYCIPCYKCLAEMFVSQESLKLLASCFYHKMADCSYSQAGLMYLSAKATFMENRVLDNNCKKYLLYEKTQPTNSSLPNSCAELQILGRSPKKIYVLGKGNHCILSGLLFALAAPTSPMGWILQDDNSSCGVCLSNKVT